MSARDPIAHVRAETCFVDDLLEPQGTLYAAVFGSPVAHGVVCVLDANAAAAASGVAAVFTARDIPGENQVGSVVADQPLLAADRVRYVGQPLAMVVADTPTRAHQALKNITVTIDKRPAVFDPRQAAENGDLIGLPRTIAMGNVDAAWSQCVTIVSGRVDSGGQEHLYLETQAALAIPRPCDSMHIFSATQSPSSVQRTVARVLACPMHAIEVEVQRVGGAFGGKEDQAATWAALAALAAHRLQRPVKLVLDRHADMQMTGKRHPYTSDYRLGLDADGRFLAFQATYYQNAGAVADLSTAVLERSLFHATNSYAIPNVRVTGICCRTHLPPFTAFRGFGAPQAMVVIEAAIVAAAETLNVPTWTLQQKNLLCGGDIFPFGMRMQGDTPRRSFDAAVSRFHVQSRLADIERRNAASNFVKRGLAVMPVCFGIAFTTTMLNQAGALVHVFVDGSVSVSTAAVEIGQGVATKLRRMAAAALGIAQTRVRIENTSTTRVANMSPTAASTAADLNGAAVRLACGTLLQRLKTVAAGIQGVPAGQVAIRGGRVWIGDAPSSLTWEALVKTAHRKRVDLSAHAFYATPELHYDRQREKGRPFAYHVCGAAVVEARLDALRGTASIESVEIVHDAGRSLDPLVDRGQVEGAVVQGIGWTTLEELMVDPDGRLLTDTLSTYKVPDLDFSPTTIEVVFLDDTADSGAVMASKAVGEPPLMYGIGAYFAIRAAIRAVRDVPAERIRLPLTHARILQMLEGE
ncbi:molybdopterin cofactor-binding domain-containing protein [Desulfosarcina ovata]|uniref:Xanthine dehydrogenase molybdopterin binding subunit n=1 Tax=Desulfosarcina ovata subsp. ovata TaxID=2752305 RepID=A0A5K8AGM9_9BACT|nr:molybdopterin cofactor-binding domain-containing protein [Desulfosarcina ovata]BBO91807.1 xanthine dehydrogenase molybdopterin binding subunit [Desulfosarcina ovata subsp. ovata]